MFGNTYGLKLKVVKLILRRYCPDGCLQLIYQIFLPIDP